MKIHYHKYLQLLLTFFFVWLFLATSKIFGFDFSLGLVLFFEIFCIFSIPYLFLEVKANRDFLKEYFKCQLEVEKNQYYGNAEEIEKKIVLSSKLFSGKSGRFLAGRIALVFAFFWEIKKILRKTIFSKYIILAFCIFGIIFEIFVITSTVDAVVIILTCVWILVIYLFKFSGKISVVGALVFLGLTPILLVIGKDFLAEKSANWAYMFLLVGVVQMAWENKNKILKYEV